MSDPPIITIQAGKADVSDGHHTFAELYEHRHALTLALMRAMPDRSWFARKHADGTMFDESFIVGVDLPQGTVTYHLPRRYYSLAWLTGAAELPWAKEWDGNNSEYAVAVLHDFAVSPAQEERAPRQ